MEMHETFHIHHGDVFIAKGCYAGDGVTKCGEWIGVVEERQYIFAFDEKGDPWRATVSFDNGLSDVAGDFITREHRIYFTGEWKSVDGLETVSWNDDNEAECYYTYPDGSTFRGVMMASGFFHQTTIWDPTTRITTFSTHNMKYTAFEWQCDEFPYGWMKGGTLQQQIHGQWQSYGASDDWFLVTEDGTTYSTKGKIVRKKYKSDGMHLFALLGDVKRICFSEVKASRQIKMSRQSSTTI